MKLKTLYRQVQRLEVYKMRIENKSKKSSQKISKENKTQFTRTKKQTCLMFVSIFFVLLLIFLGFARLMSPDVDITIGEDYNTSELNNSEDYNRTGNVDDRLKALQEEDESSVEARTEEDGLVKIPEHKKAAAEEEKKEDSVIHEEEIVKKAPQSEPTIRPAVPDSAPAPVPQPAGSITARVVVGSYVTQAQAEVAKGILQESGLGVTPHIRQIGGAYTLQVGAYSSKEAAGNLANKLLMNNYPARVIVENN